MKTTEESPGERAVKAELIHMGLDFEEQYEIHGLKDDIKGNRRSDFYLSDYNIHIEVLGNWKNDGRHDHHIEEYKKKMEVYQANNIDCIYIYPNQLTHSNLIIKKHIGEILVSRSEKKREEKELKEEAKRKEEEQKREAEKKKRAKKPVSKKQEPVTIAVNAIPSSKKNKETNSSSKQYWDIRMTLFLIIVLIIIFSIISVVINQLTKNVPEPQKSIITENSFNITSNQTQPEKIINETQKSIIKEILETSNYDNKEVTITGGYDFSINPNFKGYITDEQGQKILFTGTNRGFNPSKKYEYTGNITLTNETKYMKITKSINEVNH